MIILSDEDWQINCQHLAEVAISWQDLLSRRSKLCCLYFVGVTP